MATESVTKQRNQKLAQEIEIKAGTVQAVSTILSQLGALIAAASEKSPRQDELLALAHYLADDWANTADGLQEELFDIAKRVEQEV